MKIQFIINICSFLFFHNFSVPILAKVCSCLKPKTTKCNLSVFSFTWLLENQMNASTAFYSSTSNTLVKISLYEYGAVSFVKSQINVTKPPVSCGFGHIY